MPRNPERIPEWERLLSSAARLQEILRERFDGVLGELESVAGWKTARLARPVQESGESALQQLQAQLANPLPYDLDEANLAEYRDLAPRWQDWREVEFACGRVAVSVFDHVCDAT